MSGHRHSQRLPDVDYGRTGLYFVTLTSLNRVPMFGEIINGQVHLSPAGEIVKKEWLKTPIIRPGIVLDEWQIMPDHFHFIVDIDSETHRYKGGEGADRGVGAHRSAPSRSENPFKRESRTLGSMIGQFKSVTSHQINEIRGTPGHTVWQRNFTPNHAT